jgi:hypothetical protein
MSQRVSSTGWLTHKQDSLNKERIEKSRRRENYANDIRKLAAGTE